MCPGIRAALVLLVVDAPDMRSGRLDVEQMEVRGALLTAVIVDARVRRQDATGVR